MKPWTHFINYVKKNRLYKFTVFHMYMVVACFLVFSSKKGLPYDIFVNSGKNYSFLVLSFLQVIIKFFFLIFGSGLFLTWKININLTRTRFDIYFCLYSQNDRIILVKCTHIMWFKTIIKKIQVSIPCCKMSQ